MYNLFENVYNVYAGDITFKKKLELDSVIEKISNPSTEYIYGSNSTLSYFYNIISQSNGECFEYLASKIRECPRLKSKYYLIILEKLYQISSDINNEDNYKLETEELIKKITLKQSQYASIPFNFSPISKYNKRNYSRFKILNRYLKIKTGVLLKRIGVK